MRQVSDPAAETSPRPADPAGAGETAVAPDQRYSLRSSLLGLVALCVLPAALVAAGLGYALYWLQHDRIYRDTVLIARSLAAQLDRDLAAIESGMRVLAAAPELATNDLEAFHRRASAALQGQIVTNYLLTDRQGRQLLNTLVPFGQALPTAGTPAQLSRVFEAGTPVLTDLFIGPVVRRPVIAMGVPVFRGDEVVLSLNVGLAPDRIATILTRPGLPQGWVAAVIDGSGTIVARSREAERFVGEKAVPQVLVQIASGTEGSIETVTKEGLPVVSSFSRSAISTWSVAVGAPRAALERQLMQLILLVGLGLALALGLGLWRALHLAGRVTTAVRELNDAALALGNGQPVPLPRTRLVEADAVAQAIQQAALILDQARHQAQHDPLTGLCNRVLFNELLERQLAAARRSQTPMAVLAIDLDGFKAVNDSLGHAAGDRLLQAVATRITATLRASDAAARLGGDEFTALLPETDAEQAQLTAERLVAALFEPYGDDLPRVSASVGVALGRSGDDASSLMDRADRALYQAKRAGRNRVVCTDEPPG